MTKVTTPRPRRPNAKHLKIVCTEDQIKQIVLPIINFTAYCLSIDKVGEVPQIKSMTDSILSSKRALAMLMATKLGKVINPGDLNTVEVQAISVGGYFKISVTNGKGFTAQSYNITITGETEIPLLLKLIAVADAQYPNATEDQIRKHAIEMLNCL